MLFAQISDFHLTVPGEHEFDGIDPADYLRASVDALNRLEPQPEFVLITGDIAENGSEKEYRTASSVLDKLRTPFYVVPGNHDTRLQLYRAFAGRACPLREASDSEGIESNPPKALEYSFTHAGYRFIALDTLREGSASGELSSSSLAWLESELQTAGRSPRILFLHHPPLVTGLSLMDESRLTNATELLSILNRYPAETHLLCGHVHRPVSAIWKGNAVHTCPSVFHQLKFSLGHDPNPGFVFEPPAFRLFLTAEDTLVSHIVYTGDYGPHYPVNSE